MRRLLIVCIIACLSITAANSFATVSGDPTSDGWTFGGNSLANGLYSNGSANYSYNAYSSVFAVTAGSSLVIDDGDYSWQAGDTVIGAGGQFVSITADEAGWSAFTGNNVNSQLSQEYGPKLQVKLGTDSAAWTTSTTAPGAGNGGSSTSNGGVGTVHFRTSGWFHATTPLSEQVTDTTWIGNSGELMLLDKDDHIRRVDVGGYIYPDKRVARVIWQYDEEAGHVGSWELLLNTSLLDRVAPEGFTGSTPAAGNIAVFSVQDRDSAYTDCLVVTAPEPATICLLGFGALSLLRKRGA
ncbi:MAG: PEP-CTERM sorting domain-containing protein [Phycisphaerae bacterium]|nr:PEP-CTERM sorting domain-containing protein [Phycisphaerae bacterium]MDD5381155.1 PEP-CTERM sorting domain-containing protein [Phycisphaerae bacterium]